MVRHTIQAKLITIKEGYYTQYVFKNIDTNEYVLCTRVPNWQVPEVYLGNTGFLEYHEVKAGEEYFDPAQQKMLHYNYSNIYFINFILKSDIIQENEIIL